MLEGIYKAARMLQTKERNFDIIAGNLANINSIGYKREIAFSEYLDRFKDKNVKQLTDFSEGSYIETGSPLDLAVSGPVFFAVQSEDGLEFTKNGRFTISQSGEVVNQDGMPLATQGGVLNVMDAIFKKEKSFSISESGEIKLGDRIVDKLLIVEFEDETILERTEGQRFKTTEDNYTYADESEFKIMQGYLEESNVSPIMEMQMMMQLNKDFESTQKMIASYDSIMGQAKDLGKI